MPFMVIFWEFVAGTGILLGLLGLTLHKVEKVTEDIKSSGSLSLVTIGIVIIAGYIVLKKIK